MRGVGHGSEKCKDLYLRGGAGQLYPGGGSGLGFSQSTVSFQVKQLESELGVRLFDRIHHTVNLTEQGREVLRYAHRLDKLTKELDNDLRADKEMVGHIRLAMADSLCDRLERAFHGFWQRVSRDQPEDHLGGDGGDVPAAEPQRGGPGADPG